MYRITHGRTRGLRDVEDFLALLRGLRAHDDEDLRELFVHDAPLVVARAPGRMDVMGGIADYSGSLVLQMPIAEAALVAVQRVPGAREVRIVSLGGEERAAEAAVHLGDLEHEDGAPVSYSVAQERLSADPLRRWAAYLVGTLLVLMHEKGVRVGDGVRILLDSKVPEGKGVSSSAAIEVATMQALAVAYDVALSPRELALLCQKAENLVVGAPCGVMDQMASACGEEGRLLALLCQPAELLGTLPIPDGLGVWGIDSGIRHAVSGADYGSVRVGAFMGYRILASLAGMTAGWSDDRLVIDDHLWKGHLANVHPSEWAAYEGSIPEALSGREFIELFQATTDRVTSVDAQRRYAVRAPAAHPVHEHHRIRVFAELLAQDRPSRRACGLLGELMYQSHASYSACGLGSAGTDALVQAVRRVQRDRHELLGAKITGGGSGGTVAVLGRHDAESVVRGLARGYAEESGLDAYVFAGSSPGAAEFGHLVLIPD